MDFLSFPSTYTTQLCNNRHKNLPDNFTWHWQKYTHTLHLHKHTNTVARPVTATPKLLQEQLIDANFCSIAPKNGSFR